VTRPIVVCGLLFGDEGKGRVVDALVRRLGAREVVRFGGGPQAAHHVVAPDGRSHVFAQFGAGMLVPGTRARITRGMLVDPLALVREAEALAAVGVADALRRLAVDPRCRIVTPMQKLVGQMRELARGGDRHGSCGRGVGEAARDAAALGEQAPLVGDLLDAGRLTARLRFLYDVKLDHAEQLAEQHAGVPGIRERYDLLRTLDVHALAQDLHAVTRSGLRVERDEALRRLLRNGTSVVFEGSQGILLDAERGFTPHVTATDTTPRPALDLIAELAPDVEPLRLGVTRAYATRHGAGPFPTEDPGLSADDPCNLFGEWQGPLRVGWPDLVLLRYAVAAAGGVDAVAVTCLDRAAGLGPLRAAEAYRLEDAAIGSPLFETSSGDQGRVVAIRAGEAAPIARAALTRALGAARPLWREVGTPADFIHVIGGREGLNLPVALSTCGPTASDTTWHMTPNI
jgi:adenylosuccinate synthase